jgi:hypothetical protein
MYKHELEIMTFVGTKTVMLHFYSIDVIGCNPEMIAKGANYFP